MWQLAAKVNTGNQIVTISFYRAEFHDAAGLRKKFGEASLNYTGNWRLEAAVTGTLGSVPPRG
jgi:hypothetical protein